MLFVFIFYYLKARGSRGQEGRAHKSRAREAEGGQHSKAHRQGLHGRRLHQECHHRRDHEDLRRHADAVQQEPQQTIGQILGCRVFAKISYG